jgi:hypothetical protein
VIRKTLSFFACTFACSLSLACGGRIIGTEPKGGHDGGTGPETGPAPDGSNPPDVTVTTDSAPPVDAPVVPDVTLPPPPPVDAEPPPPDAGPPPNEHTYHGDLTCVAGPTTGTVGTGGSCSIDFKGHCNHGVTFEIDCQCPQKMCTCSASTKTMGSGGGDLSYDGCSSSCSMEDAWKACADVFLGF